MTSKLTPAQLDEIEAAAKKATPGPWRIDAFDELRGGDGAVLIWGDCTGCAVFDDPDGEHIAMMDPTTTLALVAEARNLRASVERVRALHTPMWIAQRCKRPRAGCGADGCAWSGARDAYVHLEGFQMCSHCVDTGDPFHAVSDEWPCPTIKALGEEA